MLGSKYWKLEIWRRMKMDASVTPVDLNSFCKELDNCEWNKGSFTKAEGGRARRRIKWTIKMSRLSEEQERISGRFGGECWQWAQNWKGIV